MKSADRADLADSVGPGSRARPKEWIADLLSRKWWQGLGVLLATAVALLIYFLSSGSSSSYSNTGNCIAQGSGNTVTCSGAGSGAGR